MEALHKIQGAATPFDRQSKGLKKQGRSTHRFEVTKQSRSRDMKPHGILIGTSEAIAQAFNITPRRH